jgi:ethanolamine utilization protein EutQ (cupin superfamily)
MRFNFMKNKYVALGFVLCLLASCSGTTSSTSTDTPISESCSSSTSSEKKTYRMTRHVPSNKIYANSMETVMGYLPTYYFEGYEDIPYVELSEFYVDILSMGSTDENAKSGFKINDNVVTNLLTKASMTIDVENNKIIYDDFDMFNSYLEVNYISNDYTGSLTNKLAKVDAEKSKYTKGHSVTFDLSHYQAQAICYQGKYYLPFTFMTYPIFSGMNMTLAFNGDDFYTIDNKSLFDMKNKKLTDYGSTFYKGSLSKTRSTSYAKFFYNSFLFLLENFEGHYGRIKEEKKFTDLDSYISTLGLKEKLLSTDSDTANDAFLSVIQQVFGDGGHTMSLARGMTSEFSFDQVTNSVKKMIENDTRSQKSQAIEDELTTLRKEKIGEKVSALDVSGETAVIRFDNFLPHGILTTENVTQDTESTFGIVYNAFQKIKTDYTAVKNVVFDVTLNGGGAAPALIEVLSFMTDDPITFTTTNLMTSAVNSEVIQIDNNLDGNFDDKDSYQGKYNFYVMTSGFSFSCGNALPSIAKEYGYAKIIGTRSGGGDCVVFNACTIDGGSFLMSANASITRKDGTNVDDGVAVDYELDSSYYYDSAKLDGYLKTK